MLIDIAHDRYSKITRQKALTVLESADIKPDKFTAHRDRTFTARYLRSRIDLFKSNKYEEQMEIAADNAVAIFKRPSKGIDKGKYVSLRFGFAAMERLGLHGIHLKADGTADDEAVNATNGNGKSAPDADTGDVALLFTLVGAARDMRQLVTYIRESIDDEKKAAHARVSLDELQKLVNTVTDGLHKLVKPQE